MKEIFSSENFSITEVEESDFEEWIKEKFEETHPETIVQEVFRKDVMDILTSDRHKTRDGILTISYDYWDKKWYIEHPGYVREAEAEGDSYLEAVRKFMSKMRRENNYVLYQEIEDRANSKLPPEISIEIEKDWISIYRTVKGQNRLEVVARYHIEGSDLKDILQRVKNIIEEYINE